VIDQQIAPENTPRTSDKARATAFFIEASITFENDVLIISSILVETSSTGRDDKAEERLVEVKDGTHPTREEVSNLL